MAGFQNVRPAPPRRERPIEDDRKQAPRTLDHGADPARATAQADLDLAGRRRGVTPTKKTLG